MTALILDPSIDAVLLGAGEPPGPDERRGLEDVAAVVAAAAARRPELTIILAGSMSEQLGRFDAAGGERQGEVLLAPVVTAGDPPGSALRELLDDLRAPRDDARRAVARAAGALADALDRRIEVVDIGFDGGLRATAAPGVGGARSRVISSFIADACLVPPDPDDAAVDRVLAWSTMPVDRHRLRDRLRELRIAPWSDAAGDGARLRLAAARAALTELVAATPEQSAEPAPDLIVVSGGAWAVAPGPGDRPRDRRRHPAARPRSASRSTTPVCWVRSDRSRTGPNGASSSATSRTISSPRSRASSSRPGSGPAEAPAPSTVQSGGSTSELELIPGALELVDLPPGQVATAELRFRDTVRLGGRGRRFAIELTGGLGGVLLDLRDIPLRLPDRAERRRELLEAWQDSLWVTRDL